MKTKIGGHIYDTETAVFIGEHSDDSENIPAIHVVESLYKTPIGMFFIHARGGKFTRFAECEGKDSKAGEKIINLSMAEAEKWAKENLSDEDYQREFSDPQPNDQRVMSVRVPEKAYRDAKAYSLDHDMLMGDIVAAGIELFVNQKETV